MASQSLYQRQRDLLTRCLVARLPSALRSEIETLLTARRGRKSKTGALLIATLRAKGLSTKQIAERLGCHPSNVLRAELKK